ncbi:MAG: hypothetical protein HC882_07110 [Acidobacteria bacterium]|nr:hypothetical protein [Acidobacteriota bacterium]
MVGIVSLAMGGIHHSPVAWVRSSTIAWTVAPAAVAAIHLMLGEHFGMALFARAQGLAIPDPSRVVSAAIGVIWGIPVCVCTGIALQRFSKDAGAPEELVAATA